MTGTPYGTKGDLKTGIAREDQKTLFEVPEHVGEGPATRVCQGGGKVKSNRTGGPGHPEIWERRKRAARCRPNMGGGITMGAGGGGVGWGG